jgi:hypothetical protein
MKKDKKILLIGCLSVFAMVIIVVIIVLGIMVYFVGSSINTVLEMQKQTEANLEKSYVISSLAYDATPQTIITSERYLEFIEINQDLASVIRDLDFVQLTKAMNNPSDDEYEECTPETFSDITAYFSMQNKAHEAYLDALLDKQMTAQEFLDLQYLTWLTMARAERTQVSGMESLWTNFLKNNFNLSLENTTNNSPTDDAIAMGYEYPFLFSATKKEEKELADENFQVIINHIDDPEVLADIATVYYLSGDAIISLFYIYEPTYSPDFFVDLEMQSYNEESEEENNE